MKNILKREEIENMEGVDKTHFLNPNAKRLNKSLGDLTGLKRLGFHIIEIQPGFESTEFHNHYHEDECTYILCGSGVVTIGEIDYEVSEGDFIGYPAGGEPHTMINTGKNVLKCIVVGQRLPHDIGDYPRKNLRIFRDEKLPVNVVSMDDIDEPEGVGKK